MESPARAATFFPQYGMGDALQFSDPTQTLYTAFELKRTTYLSMISVGTIWRFFKSFFGGHGSSISSTDMKQMPGGFLVRQGRIVKSFRHKAVHDRPDYCELARG